MTSVVLGSVGAPWRVASRTSARRRVGGRAVAVQQHRMGVAVKMGKGAGVLEGGGDGGVVGLAAARRSQVVTRATQESTDEEEAEEEEQRLAESELARLRQLPLSDSINGEGGENVVGAEGVPKAIIEAERKSKPLRRWRLVIYALASSAAAAQMVTLIDMGIMQWPEWLEGNPIMLATDILVIISGSLLWRMELANRAESLKMIWQKAQSREESLNRAEAGLGDTLWTSRMRKKTDQNGK